MYEIPSPAELREFLKKYELTGSAAGALVGVDSRTVRKWTAEKESKNHKNIPWSAWALLRLMVGDTTVEELKEKL